MLAGSSSADHRSSCRFDVHYYQSVLQHGCAGYSSGVRSCRGGVLFIDEAYSLHQKSSQDDLGQETINTIVKLMEDMRSEVVVIMAGYEKEMKDFLSSNSGLESRFTYKFHFADYTVEELVQMFDNRADKLGWEVDDDAKTLIRQDFEQACRGDHFGNG